MIDLSALQRIKPQPLSGRQRDQVLAEMSGHLESVIRLVRKIYGSDLLPAYRQLEERQEHFHSPERLYTTTHQLDSGGIADIFLLAEERLVIKSLKKGNESNQAFINQLKNEGLITLGIKHKGVVKPLDFSFCDDGDNCLGQNFIVYPFVRGLSLAELTKKLPEVQEQLKTLQILSIFLYISGILAALEDKGILHRDIKPDNFMLSADRLHRVLLLDFGFATEITQPNIVLPAGFCCGHLDYIAPELNPAGSNQANIRSEIFAFGVTFLKMFFPELNRVTTPQDFFAFVGPDSKAQVLTDEMKAGLSPRLIHFIELMVDREPRNRFSSFKQINVVLQHLLLEYANSKVS